MQKEKQTPSQRQGQPTVVPAVLGTGILCFVPTFGEERHFVSDDSFFLSAAPSESVWEKTDNAIGRSLMARPNTKLSCLFFLTEVE